MRILVMPAGHFQVPAVLEAQRMGLEVLAIDRNPQAEALGLADFGEVVDPLQVERTAEVVGGYGVDAVVAVASDPSVVPASQIAERLGLAGLPVEVARLCRNKQLARARLRECLPQYCPGFLIVSSTADLPRAAVEVGLPLVLKPTVSNGSKGTIIVSRREDLESGYGYALRYANEGPVIAEELLRGDEISVEALSFHGATEIVAMADVITTEPPFCAVIGHTMPSTHGAEDLGAVAEAAREIIGAFGIRDGPTHIEMFLTEEGPKLVEIGARLSGGCISSHLVPLSVGVNMTCSAILIALGEAPQLERTRNRGASIRFLTPDTGIIRSIRGVDTAGQLPGVVEVQCALKRGDSVLQPENSDGRVGYVIAEGKDGHSAVRNAKRAVEAISIVVE